MGNKNKNKKLNTVALPDMENGKSGINTGNVMPEFNTAPHNFAPVMENAGSENKVVSVAGIPNLNTAMVTTTITGSDGKETVSVTDMNLPEPAAKELEKDSDSAVVVGTEGVAHGQEPQKLRFYELELSQKGPEGIKFDFNDGLRVYVPKGKYRLVMIDLSTCLTLFSTDVSDITIASIKKYYVPMRFEVWRDERMIFSHDYDAKGKNVLLKYPGGKVIGDALAWFPYAEEFRKKHQCNVYVVISQQMTDILQKAYPELHFVVTNDEEERDNIVPQGLPKDIYATYRLGVFFPCDDRNNQPVDFRVMGLHRNAALILGLNEWEEHPPRLLPSDKEVAERTIKEPYVCIAANGSSQAKHWNNARGWMNVVRYLKSKGYRVLCIDREDNHQVGSYMNSIPYGCEDFTGDKPLQERIDLMYHADFFIGVSSGLSWMAWGVGKPVILISGFTLPVNEFKNPYRVINYNCCNGCWNDTRITFNHSDGEWCPRHKNTERQFECSRNITPEMVCKVIDRVMKDNGFNPMGGSKNE